MMSLLAAAKSPSFVCEFPLVMAQCWRVEGRQTNSPFSPTSAATSPGIFCSVIISFAMFNTMLRARWGTDPEGEEGASQTFELELEGVGVCIDWPSDWVFC